MRQLPVADQDAQPAGGEIGLCRGRDAVCDRRQSDDVVGAIPCRTLEGNPCRQRMIDIGELVGLLAAVIETETRECTEVGGELLLEIEDDARTPGIVADQGRARY